MTDEQKAAFIIAQATCAMAEIEAMKTTNTICQLEDRPLRYTYDDFMVVIQSKVIGHNAVLNLFQN